MSIIGKRIWKVLKISLFTGIIASMITLSGVGIPLVLMGTPERAVHRLYIIATIVGLMGFTIQVIVQGVRILIQVKKEKQLN